MAYYSQNGTGIDSNAYIYVQLQVTRTDYDTYSRFDLKSVAVSDTGTSGFIRGQVTTNQAGTSWTASTGWKDVYYNGTTTLATSSFNINRGSSDKTVRCGAYAEGGGSGIYAGGTDYAWLNVTVPKVESPNAPSNCSVSYVSDSSASVSWNNGSTTTAKPRTATLIERQTDGGSWVQVTSVGSSVSNWTDNGISANHSYLYRVRAQNSAGYSAYSTAPSMIFTTPAAPSDVLLNKTAATTVQLDVSGSWPYTATFDVQSTYDGGTTWTDEASDTSVPVSITVNAGTVRFRVRARMGDLASDWTLSQSLVTITPPLAPTITQRPNGNISNGSTVTIGWTPNHPDGSAQESAQVKVAYPNGTSTTFTVTATSWTSNALTVNGTYSVQVRTKGLDPDWGAWSDSVSWGVYNLPSVVITSPATDGTDIVSLPMTVSWSVTDSTGVSTQRIIIEGDGEILNRTLAGDVRTVALNASDVALENGQTYTIRLRVMGGSGLVTEQTRIFDVAWLAPAAPVLQLTEGEGRSATIDVMDTHYSESGSTIAVGGSAIADEFTVFGKSTQDGTPTPSAPVPIESVQPKNILNPTARTVTSNGVTYTCSADGLVTLSGTATATNWFTLKQASTFPAGTYTASKTGGISEIKFGNTAAQVVTKTYSAAWSSNDLAVYVYQGSTYDESFYVQLERGDTASDYVPYGVIELYSASRNILSPEPRTASDKGVTYTCASDGTITLQGTCTGFTYFTIKRSSITFPAGTYTFSKTGGESNVYWIGKGTERDSITQTTTGDTDIRNLCISVEAGKVYNETFNVQLERGSTATEYVPYEVTTYPIDLQGNSICSLPDGTRDELRVGERKVLVKHAGRAVIDGVNVRALTVAQGVAIVLTGLSNVKPADSNSLPAPLYCDHLPAVSSNSVYRSVVGIGIINNGNVVAHIDGISTVSDANTWFAANPTEFVYALATPQEIDLGAASDHPFIPEGGEMWVDGTTMDAVLRPADYAGQPTIESVDVQRVNADGTAWTVATGLTVGGSCIDPLPPLGVDYTYRAVASAASGATSSAEVSNRLGGCKWALNFGQAASACKLVGRNPSSSVSYDHGGELYHFARGFQNPEDMLPEFYPVGSIDANGTLEFDAETRDEANEIMALMFQYPVAWLRTPFGERRRVRVKPTYNLDRRTKRITVSYDLIRFGEAW